MFSSESLQVSRSSSNRTSFKTNAAENYTIVSSDWGSISDFVVFQINSKEWFQIVSFVHKFALIMCFQSTYLYKTSSTTNVLLVEVYFIENVSVHQQTKHVLIWLFSYFFFTKSFLLWKVINCGDFTFVPWLPYTLFILLFYRQYTKPQISLWFLWVK